MRTRPTSLPLATLAGILLVSLTAPAFAASLTLSPAVQKLEAGAPLKGVVTLNAPAPATGLPVVLSSSNAAAAAVPVAIGIAAGALQGAFSITVKTVATDAPVRVTATSPLTGPLNVTFTVLAPAAVTGLTISPDSVSGGQPAMGTVTLSRPAGFPVARVSLASNNPAVTVPAQTGVPMGASSVTFSAKASNVTQVINATITASAGGTPQSGSLTVQPSPPRLIAIILPSQIECHDIVNYQGEIVLDGVASVNTAVAVALSANLVMPGTTLPPPPRTVVAGASRASFVIAARGCPATGGPNEAATVTATLGADTKSATVMVLSPPDIAELLVPSPIQAGIAPQNGPQITGTVTIMRTWPRETRIRVTPDIKLAPSSSLEVVVPSGQTSAFFQFAARGLIMGAPSTTGTITALPIAIFNDMSGGSTLTANTTIVSTPLVATLSVPSPIVIGAPPQTATMTLTHSGLVDQVINLIELSPSGSPVLNLPASVTVPAGQLSATFPVSAKVSQVPAGPRPFNVLVDTRRSAVASVELRSAGTP